MGQSWRLSGLGRSYGRWRLTDRHIDRCRLSPGWLDPDGERAWAQGRRKEGNQGRWQDPGLVQTRTVM